MQTHLGEIISLGVAVSWTITALCFEYAGRRMHSTISLNIIRLVMALVLLALTLLIFTGNIWPQNAGKEAWLWLGVSGLVGYVFGDYCLFSSYLVIGSRFGQLFMTLAPPSAALGGWLILGEHMGYKIAEGPELEQDHYNFELANIPQDHPARDMQDTFYIDPNTLLRTHTTAMQMRELEKANGRTPIKLICPGKVYRRDDDDATHSHQFMQCEGLVVGEHVTLTDLKGTLEFMANKMFGEGRKIRFRPSYFPFTEPSVEVDVSCPFCNGRGCSVCKGSGWIEILGAGMVHPHVLEMNGFDPEKCSGFAFGVGLERVAMLKYGINDIRNFYINDERFLNTFDRFD